MRIDFLGLEAFLSVVDRGSFQRAAAHLSLSQTAISHRMRKLEEELGVKLLARTTREISLTRAGTEFLPKARKAITELELSFDEMRQQGVRRLERLDIACLPAFAVHYLPPVLRRFHAHMPRTEVRIHETPSTAIAELVQSGEAELGFGVIQTNRWDLEVQPISSSPLALACPAVHPLSRRRSIRWRELRGVPLIRVGSKTAIRPLIDDALAAHRLELTWQHEVQHVETAVGLVEEGLGLAVVPRIDVALHRGGRLAAIPLSSPKLTCVYGLQSLRGAPLSAAAELLKGLMIEQFQKAS